MAVEAVFAVWNEYRLPANLEDIYHLVKVKISKAKELKTWKWGTPSKRTIDRRVSDAADPKFYEVSGVPKIVAVTAGIYRPNPILFEDARKLGKVKWKYADVE